MGLVSVVSATVAQGHHSAQATYHTDQVIEVEGEITSYLWRNPHIRFTIRATDRQGGAASWAVESVPVTRLSRVGVPADVISVGQRVKVAGFPSKRPENMLYALNMLLPDGREVLLDTPEARWTNNTIGTGLDATPGGRAADPALGIYRVWSADESRIELDRDSNLFTDTARASRAAWDPLLPDNPFFACTRGMPTIMESPNPMELVDRGDHILIRMESFDTVRTISMEPDPVNDDVPATILGHSVGHWEGRILVVETDRISWRYFNQAGVLQSEAIELVERFTPSEDGARLDYELTVMDPALFTEPAVLTRSWVWVPGDQVLPFDCTEG